MPSNLAMQIIGIVHEEQAIIAERIDAELAGVREALESAANCMSFSARDWAQDKRDAWLYGLIVGWDEASLAELGLAEADRLTRLRAALASLEVK